MAIKPALIGKAGELLVAAELLRRGLEVAYPASDVGVDILAYRLSSTAKAAVPDLPDEPVTGPPAPPSNVVPFPGRR